MHINRTKYTSYDPRLHAPSPKTCIWLGRKISNITDCISNLGNYISNAGKKTIQVASDFFQGIFSALGCTTNSKTPLTKEEEKVILGLIRKMEYSAAHAAFSRFSLGILKDQADELERALMLLPLKQVGIYGNNKTLKQELASFADICFEICKRCNNNNDDPLLWSDESKTNHINQLGDLNRYVLNFAKKIDQIPPTLAPKKAGIVTSEILRNDSSNPNEQMQKTSDRVANLVNFNDGSISSDEGQPTTNPTNLFEDEQGTTPSVSPKDQEQRVPSAMINLEEKAQPRRDQRELTSEIYRNIGKMIEYSKMTPFTNDDVSDFNVARKELETLLNQLDNHSTPIFGAYRNNGCASLFGKTLKEVAREALTISRDIYECKFAQAQLNDGSVRDREAMLKRVKLEQCHIVIKDEIAKDTDTFTSEPNRLEEKNEKKDNTAKNTLNLKTPHHQSTGTTQYRVRRLRNGWRPIIHYTDGTYGHTQTKYHAVRPTNIAKN